MHAKMPGGQKIAETGDYLCQNCETQFHFEAGLLTCPKCGSTARNELIPIYVEENPEEEQMYTRGDFGQGD
jgi:hypothetical protein